MPPWHRDVCRTCASVATKSPSRAVATASTSAVPYGGPEYPTPPPVFGFFSRSLPRRPRYVMRPPSNSKGKGKAVWDRWPMYQLEEARAALRSMRISIPQVRPASAPSRAVSTRRTLMAEPVEPVREYTEEDAELVKFLDDTLPSVRVEGEISPLTGDPAFFEPRLASTSKVDRGGSGFRREQHDSAEKLAELETDLEKLGEITQSFTHARWPLPVHDVYDFLRLFPRLAAAVPGDVPLAVQHEFFRKCATHMEEVMGTDEDFLRGDDTGKVSKSRPLLVLSRMVLAGSLPTLQMESTSSLSESETLLHHCLDLLAAEDDRGNDNARTLLSVLLEAWRHAEGGPDSCAALLKWVDVTKVLPLRMPGSRAGGGVQRRREGFATLLRRTCANYVALLRPSPAEWFAAWSASTSDPATTIVQVGLGIVYLLALQGGPGDARDVLRHLRDAPVSTDDYVQSCVLVAKGFAQSNRLADADQQLVAVADYIKGKRVALSPEVKQLVAECSEDIESKRRREGTPRRAVPARAMEAERVVKTLDRIKRGPPGRDLASKVNRRLHRLMRDGNLESAVSLFRAMEESVGWEPTMASHASMVALLGRAFSAGKARAHVDRMVERGMTPSQHVYTALLHAYMSSEDWSQGVALLEHLQTHPDARLRPLTPHYNIVLKAFVTLNRPIEEVLGLFRAIVDSGRQPDRHSYYVVLQALCEARMIRLAEQLFVRLDSGSSTETSEALQEPARRTPPLPTVAPDTLMFSIMLNAYLRAGLLKKAQACLAAMQERRLKPDSVTYGLLVKSVLDQGSIENAEVLVERWAATLSPPGDYSRDPTLPKWFQHVLSPIVSDYAKRGDVKEISRHLARLRDYHLRPTTLLYTTIIEGFERAGQPVQAMRFWRQLKQDVQQLWPDKVGDASQIDQFRRTELAIPFSIVMRALASTHRQSTIFEEWKALARAGFAFDAKNWNDVGTVMATSGETEQLERAFWIAEHVLLDDVEAAAAGPDEARTDGDVLQGKRRASSPSNLSALKSPDMSPDTAFDDLFAGVPSNLDLRQLPSLLRRYHADYQQHHRIVHHALLQALERGRDRLKETDEEGLLSRWVLQERYPKAMARVDAFVEGMARRNPR